MTFEQEFNARVNAFLTRTADRLLAYIAAHELDAGGAPAPPARFHDRRPRRTR